MQAIQYETNRISSPQWAAEPLWAENLVPGPMLLSAAAFDTGNGIRVQADGGAAIGATSVTVDALADAIPSGAFLNFGTLGSVLVTINDGSISAGDVTVTVLALPGPIPSGARLNFATGTNAQVVEVNGDHAAGLTTLTILPADGTIANAATATFPGGTIQARLTADAAAAATTITVDELQFAIADNAYAIYSTDPNKNIAAGQLVGRTFTERAASTAFGPWASGDEEVYLIAFDVPDAVANPSFTAVRPGTLIKENFLPNWTDTALFTSGAKAALRLAYRTVVGAN